MKKNKLIQLIILLVTLCLLIYAYKISSTCEIDAVSSYRITSNEDNTVTLRINVIATHHVHNYEKCSQKIIEHFKNNNFKSLRLSDETENSATTHLVATVFQSKKAMDNGNILFTLLQLNYR